MLGESLRVISPKLFVVSFRTDFAEQGLEDGISVASETVKALGRTNSGSV